MTTRIIIYGDRTVATQEVVSMLSKADLPYMVTLEHSVTTTPSIDTPVGTVRGLDSIRHFVRKLR